MLHHRPVLYQHVNVVCFSVTLFQFCAKTSANLGRALTERKRECKSPISFRYLVTNTKWHYKAISRMAWTLILVNCIPVLNRCNDMEIMLH